MSYMKINMENKSLRTLKYEERTTSRHGVGRPAYYELHGHGDIEGCFSYHNHNTSNNTGKVRITMTLRRIPATTVTAEKN
jgi:hypothetical protein